MLPTAARTFDQRSVTAALIEPKTLVLKIEGRNIFILHGELMGLIIKTAVDQQARLHGMTRRSYYRLILRLVANNPLKIVYTPGHSSEVSVPARMNFEADHYASSVQRHLHEVFTMPLPTFFMDEFTFHTHDDGWIESNIRTYVNQSQVTAVSIQLAACHYQRMALHLYDDKSPPKYSYTHAYSAYSAVVQLYTCSGQLPSADILEAN
ncbi:hypothetical protein DFH09DRAFT_1331237 [Mycena vulgaris]|nr:hypothetical protein DFH09DRAFT_1331237 [Mycena vulgaris]